VLGKHSLERYAMPLGLYEQTSHILLYFWAGGIIISIDRPIVTFEETRALTRKLVAQISSSGFEPDTVLALSTGGFPVGAAIAKQLKISGRNVIGLPTYKDETGDYHLDEQLVQLLDFTGRTVLVVDEASKRGLLTKKIVDIVEQHGGTAKSCVLMAWEKGVQPDFVAITCAENVPDFYWEEI
jgi:hypoxanthine phosphoribosyltransferase